MIFKNILFPAVFVVVIGSAAAYGATQVHAQTNNPVNSLVDRIAQKFGLDKTQVQSVFDDFRKERHQDRLAKLVSDGKITEEQKQAILAKQEELRSMYNPDMFKNLTPEERRAKMKEMQESLKSWAESQNIDLKVLGFGFGFRGMGHMGMGGKFMWK